MSILFKNFIIIIILFISAGIIAVGVVGYAKLKRAESESLILKAERDKMSEALGKLVQINTQSQKAINDLEQEKIDIETSLKSLELRNLEDQKAVRQLSEIIKVQSVNPENQAKLSPVLQELVSKIQKNRNLKLKVSK